MPSINELLVIIATTPVLFFSIKCLGKTNEFYVIVVKIDFFRSEVFFVILNQIFVSIRLYWKSLRYTADCR